MKPNYGIDAPGLVRTFFAIAAVALLLLAVSLVTDTPANWQGNVARTALAVVGAYTLGMGVFMVNYSRNTKLLDRERLLNLIDFEKAKEILDIGCGRGLMMIGAAKRMTEGKAVGVDLWLEKDQAGNRPDATLENARLENVVNLVEVQTADMRKLPFANESFDAVLSHWALHNIEELDGRTLACQEAYRVLRVGGVLALADIANHNEYVDTLQKVGFTEVEVIGESWKTNLCSIISFGSFKPIAIYGRKA